MNCIKQNQREWPRDMLAFLTFFNSGCDAFDMVVDDLFPNVTVTDSEAPERKPFGTSHSLI